MSLAIGTEPGGGRPVGLHQPTTGGVATFSGCKIDKPGNGYTLVATDGTLQPGTSKPFNIVTPALTSFEVVPATNNQTAGTAFNVTITGARPVRLRLPGIDRHPGHRLQRSRQLAQRNGPALPGHRDLR